MTIDTTSASVIYDDYHGSAEFLQNPYPALDLIRERAPIQWSERMQAWVLTRYEDIRKSGRDPRQGQGDRARGFISKLTPEQQAKAHPLCEHMNRFTSFCDPPEHTIQRGLVNKSFTARVVENLRPDIQRIVDGLLDRIENEREVELKRAFSLPLSSSTICAMLGVGDGDRLRFIEWVEDIFSYLGSELTDFELAMQTRGIYSELTQYLRDVLARRRASGRDREDLIGLLIAQEKANPEIDESRILPVLIGMVQGGFETTMTMMTSGLHLLMEHPEQARLVGESEEMALGAVDEVLRCESSLKYVMRAAYEDFDWDGHAIRKGQNLMLMLNAGNRDPAVYPDPHRFDITRKPNPHLAFGVGIHICLGAPLARLQGRIALHSFFKRFPNARLAHHEPRWIRNAVLRQLEAVHTIVR